jgi:hypothetical protein
MDLIPIALSVMAGATVGAGTMARIAGGKIEELRETIAAKQAHADELPEERGWSWPARILAFLKGAA